MKDNLQKLQEVKILQKRAFKVLKIILIEPNHVSREERASKLKKRLLTSRSKAYMSTIGLLKAVRECELYILTIHRAKSSKSERKRPNSLQKTCRWLSNYLERPVSKPEKGTDHSKLSKRSKTRQRSKN